MCITVRARARAGPGILERPREMRSGLLPRLGPSRVESWRALSGGGPEGAGRASGKGWGWASWGGEYLCLEAARRTGAAAPSHRRCYPGASLLSG